VVFFFGVSDSNSSYLSFFVDAAEIPFSLLGLMLAAELLLLLVSSSR